MAENKEDATAAAEAAEEKAPLEKEAESQADVVTEAAKTLSLEEAEAEAPDVDSIPASPGAEDGQEGEPVRGRFQKRIDILTRQKREAERQREEAVNYARSVIEENKRLQAGRVSIAETAVSASEGRLAAEHEHAKRLYKEAFEAGDSEKMADMQAKMAQLAVDGQRVKDYAAQIKAEKENPPPKEEPSQQSYGAPNPLAVEWSQKNPWFGKDEIMTNAAWILDRQLTQSGMRGDSEDYWTALDRGMRQEFPHKFKAPEAKPQAAAVRSAVAPAKRTGATSRESSELKLTPSQERLIQRLRITKEDYIKHYRALEKNANG